MGETNLSDGKVIIDANLDTTEFENGLNKMKSLASKGAKILGTAFVTVGTAALVSGLKYNATIEQYQTSFEVMTGSAEKATEIIANLKKVGAETPFEMTDLANTTVLLMNYGLSADDAQKKIMMLGDISQGSAEKMNGISTAYGQMSSAGKVSLEDIKQMIERGYNPLSEISQTTGESMASLYDRISKGTISVDEITASMERSTSAGGKYFGSMDKQSQTLNGQLSTLKDNTLQLLGNALEPVSKKLANDIVPKMISGITDLSDKFEDGGASVDDLARPLKLMAPVLAASAAGFTALKIIGVINGVSKTYAITLATVTAMEKANALQLFASTGALTAKEFAVSLLTGKLTRATVAQAAWNAVMALSGGPIGLALVGVTALAAGIIAYSATQEQELTVEQKAIEASKKRVEQASAELTSSKDRLKSYEDLVASQDKQATADITQLNNSKSLFAELQTLVDANGQVKDGYADRAAFITGELASALGIEITTTDGVIQNYADLQTQISKTIEQKRIQAVVAAEEAKYQEAVTNQMALAKTQQVLYNDVLKDEAKIKSNNASIDDLVLQKLQATSDGEKNALQIKIDARNADTENLQASIDKTQAAYSNNQVVMAQYTNDMDAYQQLLAASASGNSTEIEAAITRITAGLMTATTANSTELQKQLDDQTAFQAFLVEQVNAGTPGYTQAMVDEHANAVAQAKAELEASKPTMNTAGAGLSQAAVAGAGSVGAGGVGQEKGNQFGLGLGSKTVFVNGQAINVANAGKAGLDKVDTEKSGGFFSSGFARGIIGGIRNAVEAAASLASRALTSLKEKIKEGSPSKETKKSGHFFGQGFAIGIESEAANAERASKVLANSALSGIDTSAMVAKMNNAVSAQSASISASLGANVAYTVSNANEAQQANMIDYSKLASAVVTAFVSAGITVDVNERTFGTLVNKAVIK